MYSDGLRRKVLGSDISSVRSYHTSHSRLGRNEERSSSPFTRAPTPDVTPPDYPIIAIIGKRGSGKSDLIKMLALQGYSASPKLGIRCRAEGHDILLVNTPDIEDLMDDAVLKDLDQQMQASYGRSARFNGLLFTHNIDQPPITQASIKSQQLIRKFVGSDDFDTVGLVMSIMGASTEAEANRSKQARARKGFPRSIFNTAMIRQGAKTIEFYKDKKCAAEVVLRLLNLEPQHQDNNYEAQPQQTYSQSQPEPNYYETHHLDDFYKTHRHPFYDMSQPPEIHPYPDPEPEYHPKPEYHRQTENHTKSRSTKSSKYATDNMSTIAEIDAHDAREIYRAKARRRLRTCEHCGLSFESGNKLHEHIRLGCESAYSEYEPSEPSSDPEDYYPNHNTGAIPRTCDNCGLSFESGNKLHEHLRQECQWTY